MLYLRILCINCVFVWKRFLTSRNLFLCFKKNVIDVIGGIVLITRGGNKGKGIFTVYVFDQELYYVYYGNK